MKIKNSIFFYKNEIKSLDIVLLNINKKNSLLNKLKNDISRKINITKNINKDISNKYNIPNKYSFVKYFSSSINCTRKSESMNSEKIIKEYKRRIDESFYIFEEIFSKEIKSKSDLLKYYDFDSISNKITLQGEIPLESINNSIFKPCWDMVDRGGKRWRPILGLMVLDIFNIDLRNCDNDENQKLFYKILFLVESLHNASLILDDVEDKSESRRNLPCVHLKYGEAIAINAGISFLFFPFYKIIQKLKNNDLISNLSKHFFEEVSGVHIGQGWDIEMNLNKRTPTPDNYKDIVLMKTGIFPRLIIKLLKVLIKNDILKENNSYNKNDNKRKEVENEEFSLIIIKQKEENLEKIFLKLIDIVDNMSIAFQIKDDILNISDSELAKGKGFLGEDIFEGKLTLIVLYLLNEEYQEDFNCKSENLEKDIKRLKEILSMHTKNPLLINEALEILNRNNCIKYAEHQMNLHVNKAMEICNDLIKEVERNENNFNIKAIEDIKMLINYLIDRSV